MKLGFTTLALFMQPNNEIIDLAKKHGFEIIEILGEGPFFEKDNMEFKDCGLDMRIHAATVDINVASLNKGIRAESVKQMIQCGQYAESINANTITVHPGIIGRNEPHLRKWALEIAIESIGEIIDNTNVEISVENMPVRGKFLGNTVEEIDKSNEKEENNDKLKPKLYNGIKTKNILGEGTLDLNLLKKIDTAIIELNNFDNILKSKEVIDNL